MADSNQFKIGDTVRLKSGGPVMTVSNIRNDLTYPINCVWFVDDELKNAQFKGDSLSLVTEEESE